MEKAVKKLEGVNEVTVSLLTNSMQVAYDEASLTAEKITRNLPKVMRVRIIPADSKYRSIWYFATSAMSPWPRPQPI